MCQRTLEVVEALRTAGKLSSFLLQLTPAFNPTGHRLDELESLLECLAPVPVAIELRHRAWLREREQALAWFRAHEAAFVCVDAPDVNAPHVLPPIDAATRDDLAYLRAHGRNAEGYLHGRTAAERFDWRYTDDELREIAGRPSARGRRQRQADIRQRPARPGGGAARTRAPHGACETTPAASSRRLWRMTPAASGSRGILRSAADGIVCRD